MFIFSTIFSSRDLSKIYFKIYNLYRKICKVVIFNIFCITSITSAENFDSIDEEYSAQANQDDLIAIQQKIPINNKSSDNLFQYNDIELDSKKNSQNGKHFPKCSIKLSLIEKITNKRYEFYLDKKQNQINFDDLQIQTQGCYQQDNYEAVKILILRDINYNDSHTTKKIQNFTPIFYGWMILKNPIFNFIKHEKYEFILDDIRFID